MTFCHGFPWRNWLLVRQDAGQSPAGFCIIVNNGVRSGAMWEHRFPQIPMFSPFDFSWVGIVMVDVSMQVGG